MIEKELSNTFNRLAECESLQNVIIRGLLDKDICGATLKYQGGFFILYFKGEYSKEIERVLLYERRSFSFESSLGVYFVKSGDASVSYSLDYENNVHTKYEIRINAFFSVSYKYKNKYYRFVLPIDKSEWIHQIATYAYKCETRLVKGLIDFNYEGEHYHFYPVRVGSKEYLVIESLQKTTLDQMQTKVFAAVLSVGFFTGILHLGESFIFESDDEGFAKEIRVMYQTLRPSVRSMCPIFTTNMYSIKACLEMRPELQYAKDQLYRDGSFQANLQDWLYEDTMNSIFSLLLKNPDVNRAVMTMLEVMNLPLDYQGSISSVVLETLARALVSKKPKSRISKKKWGIVERWIVADLKKAVDDDLMPNECYDYMKKRVGGMNYLPNRDLLMAPLIERGYEPSDDEIAVIDLRNTFLHGDIPDGTLDEQRDTILYASCVLQRLCSILILKTIGFEGYIINNATLLCCKRAIGSKEPVLIHITKDN